MQADSTWLQSLDFYTQTLTSHLYDILFHSQLASNSTVGYTLILVITAISSEIKSLISQELPSVCPILKSLVPQCLFLPTWGPSEMHFSSCSTWTIPTPTHSHHDLAEQSFSCFVTPDKIFPQQLVQTFLHYLSPQLHLPLTSYFTKIMHPLNEHLLQLPLHQSLSLKQ